MVFSAFLNFELKVCPLPYVFTVIWPHYFVIYWLWENSCSTLRVTEYDFLLFY